MTDQHPITMTEQHRAAPWQWETIERKRYFADYSCILELRARVETLEATQHAHVDLSHLSVAEREKTLKQIASPGRFESLEAAQPAKSIHLVERVRQAQGCGNERDARAAIREVAAWLRENPDVYFPPALVFALERETEQGDDPVPLPRAARRPKPSLKEQALIALDDTDLDAAHENILRRALEALPDD